MKVSRFVKDIMTKEVITLQLNDSLELAEKLFHKNNIRHIPVTVDNKLVGMVSKTDLLRISFLDSISDSESTVDEAIYELFTVSQIMIQNVQTLSPDISIKDVTEFFIAKEYHAFPVVEDELLVGIITTTDLLKYYLGCCE